uniref:protein-glutamine gamma-glutamyltransferase n=1 Tax=Leptobrachium leishanense TaxID=445787 RepID=A0A8C5R8J8_9ANUR
MVQPLEISFSDFHAKTNNVVHRTHEISDRRLIARRGQVFSISLHFKTRGFQKGDAIIFIAETGPWPDEASGTRAVFPLTKAVNKKTWCATMEGNNFESMAIAMSSSPNAIIGQYMLKIQITTGSKSTTYQLGAFTLLFNPWCAEDEVYMENEAQRQEYVMNDYGFVYQGNRNWITPCPWNFGQFEDDILDIILKILDKSLNYLEDAFKDLSNRNRAVYVSRVLCAMVNSNDDRGVVQGNWDEDNKSGVSPSSWNGSTAILRQWYKNDCQPVKYGQCWVFAAVMCTVMRGLGIPTRVITNFDSAHDTNDNLIIDEYYDTAGKKLPKNSGDSIWNFHVWCECWMARRDLPLGYGGWQVLDPTPQETSDGIYCCGPTSVKAIKAGDVHLDYDGPFVFSMVNADCVSWMMYGKKREKLLCDPRLVGNCISTKYVGRDDREDVTHQYKYEEEKMILLKIPYAKYGPYLRDNCLMRVTAAGEQNITWEKLLVQKDINLALPQILLNFPESPEVNKPCKVQLTFSNPLNAEIQDCHLFIEGSGLLKTQLKLQLGSMKPREKSVLEFQVVPCKEKDGGNSP